MASSTSVDRGREDFAARRWQAAIGHLTDADREDGLCAEDLERLAIATLLIGRTLDGVDLLTRAHERFLGDGDLVAAARCAGWIGMQLLLLDEQARSGGWFARAQRLVQELSEPCSIEGFLLIPAALGALYGGDAETGAGLFGRAAQIGERFHDSDLIGLGRMGVGQAQIMLGRTDEGLELFDEVMVAVTAGEISPIPSGIIYCAVIDGCHLAFDVHRAQEWTTALDRWCRAQPDLVPFSGQCRAHRAELYLLHGEWGAALTAALAAQEQLRRGDRHALFGAFYQQGEVQRLRGEFRAAADSYRRANESGFDPHPGLALLRLAQGKARVAQTLIRRAVADTDPATRRRRLPALVEIELAAGDVAAARSGADELIGISQSSPKPIARAMAHLADGLVLQSEGEAAAALTVSRRAWALWMDLDAPYDAARSRVLAGCACRALDDEDSAAMEFEAAREVFRTLGAIPALAELDALYGHRSAPSVTPLTTREVEVVRLVSTGATNRSIAHELFLSEKTVARHLSNIFTKLDLSSRAAVTAYAYEHGLVGAGPSAPGPT
jgi:DNA-binding NarL/FixJ family response regulator